MRQCVLLYRNVIEEQKKGLIHMLPLTTGSQYLECHICPGRRILWLTLTHNTVWVIFRNVYQYTCMQKIIKRRWERENQKKNDTFTNDRILWRKSLQNILISLKKCNHSESHGSSLQVTTLTAIRESDWSFRLGFPSTVFGVSSWTSHANSSRRELDVTCCCGSASLMT